MLDAREWQRLMGGLASGVDSWPSNDDRRLSRAGVLVAFIARASGINVVLTRRSEQLRWHAGQISFPGGRIEAADATPVVTARREAREEIGVRARSIHVLGTLPAYATGTGFIMLPTVAQLDARAEIRRCPSEVSEIVEVPLAFILDAANHCSHVIQHAGGYYRLGAIAYGDYFIWGATAGVLLTLYQQITGCAPLVDPRGEAMSGLSRRE